MDERDDPWESIEEYPVVVVTGAASAPIALREAAKLLEEHLPECEITTVRADYEHEPPYSWTATVYSLCPPDPIRHSVD